MTQAPTAACLNSVERAACQKRTTSTGCAGAFGLQNLSLEIPAHVEQFLHSPVTAAYLVAISLGAVFFGAMTHIGNGANFMVKTIAESAGVKCPSFFGYVFKYSLPILIPIFALVAWLFLR